MKFLAAVVVVSMVAAAAPAVAQERVTAPGGVAIEKPQGWSIVPASAVVEGLRGVRYDSPAFERATGQGGVPVLTLTKGPAGYAGINPRIEVRYQALDGPALRMVPEELLSTIVSGLAQHDRNLEILDPPAMVNFAGLGAHTRVTYVSKDRAGRPHETISEMWVTMAGGYAITLTARYDRDAPAQTMVEIDAAVRSFRIDETGPPPALYGP